jgi:hypothetical protein
VSADITCAEETARATSILSASSLGSCDPAASRKGTPTISEGNGDDKRRTKKRRGRGEGGIAELPSGKFRVVISGGRDYATDRRIKLTRTFDAEREALAIRDELLRQRRSGMALTTGRGRVAERRRQWLGVMQGQKAAQTYLPYEPEVNRPAARRLEIVPQQSYLET